MAISSVLGSSALLPAGLGFRNFVINGDMRIAQRATSQASITSGTYWTVDRYRTNYSGATGTWTQTQSTDGPAGFGNSLKMECTTAKTPLDANSELGIVQRFEGQNLQSLAKGTSSAKPLMVSFWVKSNKTGIYICELYDYDNSRNCSRSYSITTAGTWQYVTIAFPPDTTGAFANDANLSLHICWFLATGSNFTTGALQTEWGTAVTANRAVGQTNLADTVGNYFQFTGVQLEQNYQPTPFEQRPIGVELALCQRYYEVGNYNIFSGYVVNATNYYQHNRYAVVKRGTTSTIAVTSLSNSAFSSTPTVNANYADAFMVFQTSTATANVGYYEYSWKSSSEL